MIGFDFGAFLAGKASFIFCASTAPYARRVVMSIAPTIASNNVRINLTADIAGRY